MSNYNGFYNPNQAMINQLLRQKDNIDNMLNQYSQPQQPIQNIINTGVGTEFEAKVLKDDEEAENILINKRTMFLDKKNRRVLIKEIDGKISEEYEIILPKDAKDLKIEELENKLKEMEVRINNEHTEPVRTTNVEQQSNADVNFNAKSTTKTSGRAISKSN